MEIFFTCNIFALLNSKYSTCSLNSANHFKGNFNSYFHSLKSWIKLPSLFINLFFISFDIKGRSISLTFPKLVKHLRMMFHYFLVFFCYYWGLCSCFSSSDKLGTCFEDNTLFVEDSLPFSLTLDQCFGACMATASCKVPFH